MNKFKYYFILLVGTISLFSCSKNNASKVEPLRNYAVQYTTDNIDIEDYLKTHSISVNTDQDVTFTVVASESPESIWKQTALKSRNVNLHGITYKIYYFVLAPGTVAESPTNVDDVLTAYKGEYLQRTTTSEIAATTFDEVKYPQQMIDLSTAITGWAEIFPQFQTGTNTPNTDGTVTHQGFGAGVIFIPSGLAYYGSGKGTIPAYAPLIFSFKLYAMKRLDQDGDGILSYQEDLDKDRYMYDYRNLVKYPTTPSLNPDDTDKDGIPDFLDVDDDGDTYSTKLEIAKGTDYLDPNSHP